MTAMRDAAVLSTAAAEVAVRAPPRARQRNAPRHALAALLFFVAALWSLRVVLPAPARLLPTEIRLRPELVQLGRYDESMVMAVVIRNAETLLRAPGELFGVGQCFPLRRPHTLGEHMLGEGLLAVVPYALTREPILTYNIVLLLGIWIAGLATYALVFDLIGRPGPALVAGLVFALTPDRVWDVIHPFVHGDHFTPLAALCLRRLFVHGRLTAALGAMLFCSLALLESFYSIVSSGIVLGTYSVHLAWGYRAHLLHRLPLLLSVLAVLAGVGWMLFVPYLETQATLGVLAGRSGQLRRWWTLPLTQTAVVLGAIGLLDRLRRARPRDGDDPRWTFLVALLLSTWFAAPAIPLPGFVLPSPVVPLSGAVPGFDAVRAPGAMGHGAWLSLAVLAGYGTLALTERLLALARATVTAALVGALFLERNVPALATAVFGQDLTLAAWDARPSEREQKLLRSTSGPILYLPIAAKGAKGLVSADYLRLTSFAPRPTSACYSSFGSPYVEYLAALGNALPDPAAADALHALGFRTVVLDTPAYWPGSLARFERALALQRDRRLVPVGRTERLWVFQLRGKPTAQRDFRVLAIPERRGAPQAASLTVAAGAPIELPMRVKNRSSAAFVHPEPLPPSDVLVRWSAPGVPLTEQRVRLLLPLALLPGAEWTVTPRVAPPTAKGLYRVTLHPAATPDLVLAEEAVAVQ